MINIESLQKSHYIRTQIDSLMKRSNQINEKLKRDPQNLELQFEGKRLTHDLTALGELYNKYSLINHEALEIECGVEFQYLRSVKKENKEKANKVISGNFDKK